MANLRGCELAAHRSDQADSSGARFIRASTSNVSDADGSNRTTSRRWKDAFAYASPGLLTAVLTNDGGSEPRRAASSSERAVQRIIAMASTGAT
jgi:hypothetical protein